MGSEFEEVGVEAVVKGLEAFMANLAAMNVAIASTGTTSLAAKVGVVALGLALGAVALAATAIIAGVGAVVAGFLLLGKTGFDIARSVETAFAGVAKTTNGLTDEFGKMNDAGKEVLDQFRELATQVPLALEELLGIGELAGQLGIAKEALVGFSEVVAALAVTTDLTVEKATLGLARIANIYEVTAENMVLNTEKVGSALVFLGNNFATTEGEILDFAKRIAGVAKIAGITQAEILAIGAAFTSVGIEAQAGGTAVQTVIIEMTKAAAQGGESMEIFARVSGKTAEQFVEDWNSDAAGAFDDFVQGLGDSGDEAFTILEDLGVADRRVIRAFLAVAGAGDLMTRAIDGSTDAFAKNAALARETAIRYATFDSQMQIFKNTLRDIGLEIGLIVLPAMEGLLKSVGPIVEAIGEGLVPAFQSIFDALTTSLLPALGRLIEAFGFDLTGADLTQGIVNFGETIAGGIESFAGFVDEVAELVDLYREGGIDSLLEHFGIDPDDAETFLAIAAGITTFAAALWLLPPVLAAISGFSIATLFAPFIALGGVIAAIDLSILGLALAIGALVFVIIKFGADAYENFLTLKDQLGEILIKMGELISEGWTDMWDGAKIIWDNGVQFIKDKWAEILESFGVSEEIKARWGQLWEDIKTIVGIKFAELGDKIAERWQGIKDVINEFLDPIKEDIADAWEQIKENTAEGWQQIKDTLFELAVEIGISIGTFVGDWIQAIKDTWPEWVAVGKVIMDGLLQGLKNNVAQIIKFITDLASKIIASIMAAVGASSPSTKFAEVGKYMMEGLALGIAANADLPQLALDAAGASMVAAGQQTVAGTNSSGNVDNSTSFHVDANYANTESPESLVDTLTLAAMLAGAT